MNKVKFNTNKSVEVVCKEIEQMIPCVLGTKPNKEKRDTETVYYPSRRFMGTDDNMDDICIVVRKVNNSLTNIRLENSLCQTLTTEVTKLNPLGWGCICTVYLLYMFS